ncbi:MAG TPA: glycogen/starch/alpha-glucan phosphorylase, partial [Acidimicrobiales bacterium]|nr:glycogen/starch/alpha-glucan phosphorylase [Acidimicrobiales bacterium]
DPGLPTVPRVVVFGAKAAPGYWLAKEIIRLINGVAATVNRDPLAEGRLSVVFMTNYNVQRAQQIIPAANLSEQISLAGKEASGTGNMKLTLNGALTIGTLDGANIEIRDLVGAENFFLFGLTEPEVEQVRQAGYHPRAHYEQNPRIRRVLDLLASGMYAGGDPDAYRPILDVLLTSDTYLVLADYQSYLDCQDRVDRQWGDQQTWTTMSIRNVARSGWFSSDRSVQEYLDRVWHASPVDVDAWRASNRRGTGQARR